MRHDSLLVSAHPRADPPLRRARERRAGVARGLSFPGRVSKDAGRRPRLPRLLLLRVVVSGPEHHSDLGRPKPAGRSLRRAGLGDPSADRRHAQHGIRRDPSRLRLPAEAQDARTAVVVAHPHVLVRLTRPERDTKRDVLLAIDQDAYIEEAQMRMSRLTATAAILILLATWGASPLRAGICFLDEVPAATLLLPYFEV